MIACRIVAVPERLERARELAVLAGGEVILDEHHVGAFRNHQRALQSAGDATHVVVLEDDAIVCPDFIPHVQRLVAERPDHLIGLYVGTGHPKMVQPALEEVTAAAPAWLDDPRITDRLRWAVGYVMPTTDVPDVLAHLATLSQHSWLDTDKRIGSWHAARGRLSYPFPSPVDHDDELVSITNPQNRYCRGATGVKKRRVAWMHCTGRP